MRPRSYARKAEEAAETIVELEGWLSKLREEASRLEEAIAVEREREQKYRRLAEGTQEVLHKRLRSSTVNEPTMEKDHRLAISEGHRDDAFSKAIRAKGFSQNLLAKRIGMNQAVLSLHRKNLRRIKRSKAEAIEKLTGWPADAKHWPCGIVADGE